MINKTHDWHWSQKLIVWPLGHWNHTIWPLLTTPSLSPTTTTTVTVSIITSWAAHCHCSNRQASKQTNKQTLIATDDLHLYHGCPELGEALSFLINTFHLTDHCQLAACLCGLCNWHSSKNLTERGRNLQSDRREKKKLSFSFFARAIW